MTELTLPAGSLQSALHAFEGGADAVYLGLHDFSARANAKNFSWEDLAKLKRVCLDQNKRFYVTLNTLLDDEELDRARQILRRLDLIAPDGIIVQDLGLAHMMQDEFPDLELHCSTQLAVHTVQGVRMLQDLGFKRIVLSRELTFNEIVRIRETCRDVQLKTFIHGAMCYGFSGLCMASHTITGRSANRGECAQICRTWFSNNQSDGYFFSMTDLAAGNKVTALRDIGIDSLKIEGRMKSPAYVRYAARYYRMILDGARDGDALKIAKEELESQFARQSSGGWTFAYGKESPTENRHTPTLTTNSYPGHRGTRIATVTKVRNPGDSPYLEIVLEQDLATRDGLLWLSKTGNGISEAVRFGVRTILDGKGTRVHEGKAATKVSIDVPKEVHASKGDPLYRVSRHDLHVATINEEAIAPYRTPYGLILTIEDDGIHLSAEGLPRWVEQRIEARYPIEVQEAKSSQRTRANLEKIFSSPNEGLLTLGRLRIVGQSELPLEKLFLPLSRMKEIRRSWYKMCNEELERSIMGRAAVSSKTPVETHILPSRNRLRACDNPHIPWVDPVRVGKLLSKGSTIKDVLPIVDGIAYIPLPPVTFDEESMFQALEAIIRMVKNPVRVGLNNVAHIGWAMRNADVPCFADIYLYMSNRLAVQQFLDHVPSPVGLYQWVERTTLDVSRWPAYPSSVGEDFAIPLFISRSCYRYDTLGMPCEGCPRHGSWSITQQGLNYHIDVIDCVTVVSKEPEEQ